MQLSDNYTRYAGPVKGKDVDPKQTLERFKNYLKNMDLMFRISRARTAAGARSEF